MQSFCVIDLFVIAHEVYTNIKQGRHAFLLKKKNAGSGKAMSYWQKTEVG